ncbi:hypothetical protein L6452_03974 [Arctium lappa]|uniref:Uncharacterized protein n=1 Tax=Arctium lappa TaxID=4217 RepID=A0ACB9FPY1_ARCLA|nr:hypothetical protein L6452_03974 [Arctium lappa]
MNSKLPEEINIDILSRTSLKTFDAMCCTSKEISKLKYDPYFLHLYKQRNNIVSGFLVQHINGFHEFAPSHDSTPLDLGFLSPDDRILAASEKGIIVFESPHWQKLYHVCKPATNQVFELPNPNRTENLTEKVAIMVVGSNPFRYKILRLSQPNPSFSQQWDGRYTTYCCEIFDSATLSWRLLEDTKLPYDVFVTISSQPITVGGSIYLLLTNNDVLNFDFYSEKWTVIRLQIPTRFDILKLVKYEGNLALVCKPPNGGWEIWVINGTMNHSSSWKKTFVFNKKERMFLNSFYDSDTSVLVDFNTLVFYKFKKGDDSMSNKVVLSDMIATTFAFRSDFEPIDLTS